MITAMLSAWIRYFPLFPSLFSLYLQCKWIACGMPQRHHFHILPQASVDSLPNLSTHFL